MKTLILTFALLISFSSFGQTAEQYLRSGMDKAFSGDYEQAVSDFSNSIQLYSDKTDFYNKADAYYNRATVKVIMSMDYNGAIADLTKAIELDPNYARLYYQRALCKQVLDDINGSLMDYNKVLTLFTNSSLKEREAKVGASISVADNPKRFKLDNLSLADISGLAYSNRGVIKTSLNDFSGAVSDFNKAIELDPNDGELYYNKAISKYYNNDLKGACADWKKAAILGDNKAAEQVANKCN